MDIYWGCSHNQLGILHLILMSSGVSSFFLFGTHTHGPMGSIITGTRRVLFEL